MKNEDNFLPTMAYFLQVQPHTDLVMGKREVKEKMRELIIFKRILIDNILRYFDFIQVHIILNPFHMY